MQKKKIGNLEISNVLLGGELLGTAIDEKTSFGLMDRYYELGGNCVDTARLYGNGKSEETIGKWIRAARRSGREVYVSTKGGHPRLESMNVSRVSKKEIEDDINESLAALKTDTIDMYWLHRDNLSKEPEEILEFMNCFIKEGKIRNFGVSNWHADRIIAADEYAKKHSLCPIVASQIKWSLAVPNAGTGDPTLVEMNGAEYELYKGSDLPVVAYSSQGKGIFSLLQSGGVEALTDGIRTDYLNETNLRRFKAADALAKEYGVSISSIVLAYIYSNPDISAHVLIGPVNIAQLEDSLSSCEMLLTGKDIRSLSVKK